MTRKISRYPGSVPSASFINYDDAIPGQSTGFQVVGKQFDQTMRVSFWDGQKEIEGEVDSVRGPDPEEEFLLQGQATFPSSGVFQLILQNPNVHKQVQPCWVYTES